MSLFADIASTVLLTGAKSLFGGGSSGQTIQPPMLKTREFRAAKPRLGATSPDRGIASARVGTLGPLLAAHSRTLRSFDVIDETKGQVTGSFRLRQIS